MERQFTATVYVFHQNRVLLHRHAKLGKWLPPGGHMELNETPPEAARREVKEETGLDICFIEQENVRVASVNAVSFERPYLCLLEEISNPPHQHMDMIYLATVADERQLALIPEEFRWFRVEEIETLDVFPDVRELLTSDGGAFPSLVAAASLERGTSHLAHHKK